jgi:hypothetical protein
MFPWQHYSPESKHACDLVANGFPESALLTLVSLLPPLTLPQPFLLQCHDVSSQQALLNEVLSDLVQLKDPTNVLDRAVSNDQDEEDEEDDDDPLLKASIIDLSTDELDKLADPVTILEEQEPSLIETTSPASPRKRPRPDEPPRFREFQASQWTAKFQELFDYQRKHGHCLVPFAYDANPELARWVKRQRYQYKLYMDGEHSTMTQDRIQALTEIGFVWDSHTVLWQERLEELKQFQAANGHCLVPTYYSPNPQLATWTKCQRRQYKLYCEGKPSHMTAERMAALEELGFVWELRGRPSVDTTSPSTSM